jgi:GH18 family chitinase
LFFAQFVSFAGRIDNMKQAKEKNISAVIDIGKNGDGDFFASLAADKKKRSRFISFLHETLNKLPADGFLIRWCFPGCPNV